MKAMRLLKAAAIETSPLQLMDMPVPEPGEGEVLLRILACGVCRTDLHLIEGEIPSARYPIIPGHQIVGMIEGFGPDCALFKPGDRVGLGWLGSTCHECDFCRAGKENLCDDPAFTGVHCNGGYAQYMTARESFLYPLPEEISAQSAAPLLCAGIIGLRALKLSGVKRKGKLALYGFGGSAHITLQVAKHWDCEVHVFTRSQEHQALAMQSGAASANNISQESPEKFDAAILFAPSGAVIPQAMQSLKKGGTLALAGIHVSDIPALDYNEHLFYEKKLLSVTANTRQDGRELLQLARAIPIKTATQAFPLAQANEALQGLKRGRINGTAVLVMP